MPISMKTKHGCAFSGFLLLSTLAVSADTFGVGPNGFTMDFVNITNPGNLDDSGAGGGSLFSPYGGVSYPFRMGVTEVSQAMITKATASGLTDVVAGDWFGAGQPGTNVTWFEAAHFANWLNLSTGHQPAYNMTGPVSLAPWASGQAWQLGGENLFRNKDAYYFLPNEDEWYKAAFHKNDGPTDNYWDYATGSNVIPSSVHSGTGSQTAVYNILAGPADVALDGDVSPYGTRGQNGNVWEWQESAFDGTNDTSAEGRSLRGGSWSGVGEPDLRSSYHFNSSPNTSANNIGFRIASVPEPSTAVLIASACAVLVTWRRRTCVPWRM